MSSRRRAYAIMAGPRDRRFVLPIESRREITVRPAYRPSEERQEALTVFIEAIFDRAGVFIYPVAALLVFAVIIAQVWIHLHPHRI